MDIAKALEDLRAHDQQVQDAYRSGMVEVQLAKKTLVEAIRGGESSGDHLLDATIKYYWSENQGLKELDCQVEYLRKLEESLHGKVGQYAAIKMRECDEWCLGALTDEHLLFTDDYIALPVACFTVLSEMPHGLKIRRYNHPISWDPSYLKSTSSHFIVGDEEVLRSMEPLAKENNGSAACLLYRLVAPLDRPLEDCQILFEACRKEQDALMVNLVRIKTQADAASVILETGSCAQITKDGLRMFAGGLQKVLSDVVLSMRLYQLGANPAFNSALEAAQASFDHLWFACICSSPTSP
ncbi:MAG: hypothetical protein WCV84_01495 [Patescibacteria group bacterium]